MARGLLEKPDTTLHCSALGIRRPVNQPSNPGVRDRTRAHRARLQRHIERQSGKPVIAKLLCCGPQRPYLGMGGRVASANRGIVSMSQHLTRLWIHHYGPDRHFTFGHCRLRLGQTLAHIVFIIHTPMCGIKRGKSSG